MTGPDDPLGMRGGEGVFYTTKELIHELTSTLARIEAKLDGKADSVVVDLVTQRVRVLEDAARERVGMLEEYGKLTLKVEKLDDLRMKLLGGLTVLGAVAAAALGIAAHAAGWL